MAGQISTLALGVIFIHVLSSSATECNWQYFKHYEQKGCKAVLGDDGCPVRFHCKELSDKEMRTCVNNGQTFKKGERIENLGPCDSCNCIVSGGSAHIECASVDCPDWEPRNKSCYMGFKPSQCCPEEICPKVKEVRKTCEYNGKDYKIGQYIQLSDPCKSCICTEEWTGESGPGCSDVNCLTGIYANEIRKGCLPIYSENRCCMSEMYCGDIHGSTAVFPASKDKNNYCYYQGKYFAKGSVAFLKLDKSRCTKCKCTTPPDFTCIRKAGCWS